MQLIQIRLGHCSCTFKAQLNQFQITSRLEKLANDAILLCQVSFNYMNSTSVLQLCQGENVSEIAINRVISSNMSDEY